MSLLSEKLPENFHEKREKTGGNCFVFSIIPQREKKVKRIGEETLEKLRKK